MYVCVCSRSISFHFSFHFFIYCLLSVMWWFQDSAETADPHDGAEKKKHKIHKCKTQELTKWKI